MDRIQWKRNAMAPSSDKFCPLWMLEKLKKAKAFHESFPQYSVTPLSIARKISRLYRC